MHIRHSLFSLLAAVVCAIPSYASYSIEAPVEPQPVSSIGGVDNYYVRSVATGTFLCNGNSYNTQLSTTDDVIPIMPLRLENVDTGDTFDYLYRGYYRSGSSYGSGYIFRVVNPDYAVLNDGVLFRDSEENAFVDLNTQARDFLWDVVGAGESVFEIQCVSSSIYSNSHLCAQSAGAPVVFSDALGEPYNQWQFYIADVYYSYAALNVLYNAIVAYEAVTGAQIADVAPDIYTVYEDYKAKNDNGSLTADEAATMADNALELAGTVNDMMRSFQIEQAVQSSPADITQLAIPNADFSDGTDYWKVSFNESFSGNVQVQSATYTNGTVQVSGFLEAWRASSTGSLPDGYFYQVTPTLPVGQYTFECDAIACNQSGNYTVDQITGAYLFASFPETDYSYVVNLQTDNRAPRHFEMEFSVEQASSVILGIMLQGTNVNWVGMDNFRLTYSNGYATDLDLLNATLASEIAKAQALLGTIPNGAWQRLSAVIDANSGDHSNEDDARSAIAAVRAALRQAQALVSAYAEYVDTYNHVMSEPDDGSDAYSDFFATCSSVDQNLHANQDVTASDIANAAAALEQALVTLHLAQGGIGADITAAYISNHEPYANGDSWEFPVVSPNAYDSGNRCAEFWSQQGAIMQQTIHNLPAGDYTLTAVAFTRTGLYGRLFAGDASIPLATVSDTEVNSRSAANVWFNSGNGVNSLNFSMPTDGDITIGLVAPSDGDAWMVWRSFSLTIGHTDSDPFAYTVGSQFDVTVGEDVLAFEVTGETTASLVAATCVGSQLTIPSSVFGFTVDAIAGGGVFQGFANLETVVLPSGLRSIGANAFRSCSALSSITIPSSIVEIGNYAFYNCPALPADLMLSDVQTYDDWESTNHDNNSQSEQYYDINASAGQLVSFDWAVSSENGFDWLTVDAGGTQILRVSGTESGHTDYQLTSDAAQLHVVYSKDGSEDRGDDKGSVSNIVVGVNAHEFMQSIGAYAFYDCSSLTGLTLPATFSSLGNYAFGGTSSLETVAVHATTPPAASESAFTSEVYSGATLVVPEGMISAYQAAPSWGSFANITDASGQQPAHSVGDEILVYLTSGDGTAALTFRVTTETTVMLCESENVGASLAIPSVVDGLTVTAISDDGVFYGNTLLTEITLPEHLQTLGRNAFRGCASLGSISIPDEVTTIGNYAFYGCSNITEYVLPASLQAIGNYAFYGNSGIVSVVMQGETPPSGQENIFSSTTYTSATLTVPAGTKEAYAATSYGKRFSENNNITDGQELSVGSEFMWSSPQGYTLRFMVLSTDPATCTLVGGADVASLVVPAEANGYSVVSVSSSACRSMTNIASVTLPDGITTIGDYAFRGCTSLASLSLPATLTDIGSYAFYGCTALVSITLPASLQNIASYAFYSCSKLADITTLGTTPPAAVASAFYTSTYNTATLHVPAGLGDAYAADSVWGRFANIADPDNLNVNITVVGNGTVSVGEQHITDKGNFYVKRETNVTVTITPDAGWRLTAVALQGTITRNLTSNVQTDGTLTFSTTESATLAVTFEPVPRSVNVVRIGKGSVSINGNRLDFGQTDGGFVQGLSLTGSAQVMLSVVPASGERLSKLTVGGTDASTRVDASNTADITDLVGSNTLIMVEFGESTNYFIAGGIAYIIPDPTRRNVKVAQRKYSGDLVIPDSVLNDGVYYRVTGLADSAFYGSTTLRSVVVPSTVANANSIGQRLFGECSRLAAIVWHPQTPLPATAIDNFYNPNLLVYTDYWSRVSALVEAKVINNVLLLQSDGSYRTATPITITLSDAKTYADYYAPYPFWARRIEYTHDYTMTTLHGVCQGWETLSLPFSPTYIANKPKRRICHPFATVDEDNIADTHPFWLYTYETDGAFHEAAAIEAYKPYLISMPNDDFYPESYNLSGTITFSADSVVVPATPEALGVKGPTMTFTPNFSVFENEAQRFILNVENAFISYQGSRDKGSAFFRQNQLAQPLLPFTAYFTTSMANVKDCFGVFETLYDAVRSISAGRSREAHGVYDLSGRRVADSATGLRPGIYVIDGRKVAVK